MGEASSKSVDDATISSLRTSLSSLEAVRKTNPGADPCLDDSIKNLRDAIAAAEKTLQNQKLGNAQNGNASSQDSLLKEGIISRADSKPEPWAQWLKLLVIWFTSLACGGLTAGMNLFIPMFADAGLFAEVCGGQAVPCKDQTLLVANLFAVAGGLMTLGLYPNGILFDMIGGRGSGIAGSFALALGAILVGVALFSSAVTLTLVGTVIMDIGNIVNGSCFMGLMWHLPDWQAFIFAAMWSTSPTAAFLPVVFRWGMSSFGFSLETCLFVYAVLMLAGALVFMVVVPTQKQFFREAERVLGLPIAPTKHSWQSFKTAVRISCSVVAVKKTDVFLYCLGNSLVIITSVPWSMQLVAFGGSLFGDKQIGDELAVFQSLSTPVVSIVTALAMGFFMDYFDLATAAYFISVGTWILVVLGGIGNYVVQQTCVILSSIISLTMSIWGMKWVALWAPPHRYGMCNATFGIFSTLSQLIGVVLWSVVNAQLEGASAFLLPLRIAGVSCAIIWSILGYRLAKKPTMVIIGSDEEELMDQFFGLKTFEDAEEVLQMTRAEILCLLASQDLKDRRLLIDAMTTQEVQNRWVSLAYRKGYELPQMDRVDYFMLVLANRIDALSNIELFVCCGTDTA